MKYFVYILYSEGFDRFYKGQTQNIDTRLARHNSGTEKATAPYKPWIPIWNTEKPTRTQDIKLEAKLKNLSKKRTWAFIKKYD